ncbi:hypothetical protein MKZ38_004689 [Zalerion maritima]|uniref:EKC/KEOPS complex subunit CGI121 n=1 Tax=Zalerion maritima TaxID=339359 RepID=A0AAD5WPE7_9PEZI|nr:hypothetical protein MKZ38_004689 [Zalerion maritima]
MSQLETVTLEHLPPSHKIYLCLFKDVQNPDFLLTQLRSRNADFEYAFIDSTSLISRLHLLAAVFRAVNGLLGDNLRTPNVHSEIVLSMSASNNIAEAYQKFGITSGTKHVTIVKVVFPTDSVPVPPNADDVWAHLSENVEGTPLPLTDDNIAGDTDWAKMHKVYKMNGGPAARLDKMSLDDKVRRKEKETLALGGMALRGT